MADDLNLTPADSGTAAPEAGTGPDEPATTEIVALVMSGTEADADGSHADGSVALVVSGTDADGSAVTPPPVAETPPVYPPAAALSNETPTITKPAPRPVTPPRPAPPLAAPRPAPDLTAPPATPAAGPAGLARPESDWASEIADRIDGVVAKVRANTSDRLVGIARMVVFGLLAAVMGGTALVLLLILFFRLLAIIPGPVWIPYLGLGAIFVLLGLFFWSKRTAKPAKG